MPRRGARYRVEHQVPLWVGEFGGAFDGPPGELASRFRALADQMDVFEEARVHWTIWTWKDIGMMGLATVRPDSEYLRLLRPVLEAKQTVGTDSWAANQPRSEVQRHAAELGEMILARLPGTGADPERFKFYMEQTALANFTAAYMHPLWARCFRDKSEAEIDRVMQSFSLKNCRVNSELLELLRSRMLRPA